MAALPLWGLLILLFGFARNGSSEQIPFMPCPGASSDETFVSFYVTPCNGTIIDGFNTCVIMHGVVATFEGYFVPSFNSTSLKVVTMITLDGIEVPSINSGYDPCYGSITPPCPVKAGETYLFNREYDVKGEFPASSLDLRFIIEDRFTKEIAACAKIPLVIAQNPAYYYED